MIFDLSGTTSSSGRAGITVAGLTVTTPVASEDTAESILKRLADQLRAMGYDIRGPEQLPDSDQYVIYVIYVISDAAGEDPTGGGFGTLDVEGLDRLSVNKQRYNPTLVRRRARVARVKIGNDREGRYVSTVEVQRIDLANDAVYTTRLAVHAESTSALLEEIQGRFPGVEAGITVKENGDRFLSFSNDKATNFPVTAVATEWDHLSKSTEVTVDEDLNWEQASHSFE